MEQEDVQQSVVAAFHSVELIDEIIQGVVMQDRTIEERVQRMDANVEHLKVMLAKEWFEQALTVQQRADIDSSIVSGGQYISQNQE